MPSLLNSFDVESLKISDNTSIHIIDIKSIDSGLKELIDTHINSIWQGSRKEDLKLIKTRILNHLKSKVDKHGDKSKQNASIAEFFLHLYLNLSEFNQECLFKNLEERSFKKGFDGFYSDNSETWIMESKSGSINSDITHPDKINEAYNDIKKTLQGKRGKNNPWENAYLHANLKDVGTSDDILKKLQKCSADFETGIYYDIKDFNVIPCSTIFFINDWEENRSEIIKNISEKLKDKSYKKINVICINKKSLNLFMDYLEMD